MSVVQAVTCMLETYLEQTDPESSVNLTTYFHSKKPPNISIKNYLRRLEDYMKCSEECYVLALIYIDRITSNERFFVIDSLCIHRLILTGVMIAAKFSEDIYYKNSYYAKVGGISNCELNLLELQFLLLLDFNLFVAEEDYQKYQKTLLEHFGQVSEKDIIEGLTKKCE
mmetsp:Transcript_453/g.478  ORF Transcript_453/g.478 Transcript_453/m.478 type:complete len:169 (+) Transcript_453:3-509(+)